MTGIDVEALLAVVRGHVGGAGVPGAVVGVLADGVVEVATVGVRGPDDPRPVPADAVVRMSSMSKPLLAVLTLVLVEDGTLALDAPVTRWLPELEDQRVVRRVDGPVDDTVPARRATTVEDLLTLRMGFGFVTEGPSPTFELALASGLGIGPPDPGLGVTPDAWVERFARLPLLHQPGEDWRYQEGFTVLAVLLERATGLGLDDLLRRRVLDPLGMDDTGVHVRGAGVARLLPCLVDDGSGLSLLDPAEGSAWARPPAMPALAGVVSTAADYLHLARVLLDGGAVGADRLLSPSSVAAMTRDHLGPLRTTSASAGVFLTPGSGWGYGVEVGADRPVPRYGWGGGLGTTWYSYPDAGVAAVLLTQCLPPPEPLVTAFWAALETQLVAG